MSSKTKTTATKEEATPALVPDLGRCPRLVWRRAFGPAVSTNGAAFFRANGAAPYQPRATPWVNGHHIPKP